MHKKFNDWVEPNSKQVTLGPCNGASVAMSYPSAHSPYYIGKKTDKYKGSQLWNNLPETLKSVQSMGAFKTGLRDYLLLTS